MNDLYIVIVKIFFLKFYIHQPYVMPEANPIAMKCAKETFSYGQLVCDLEANKLTT